MLVRPFKVAIINGSLSVPYESYGDHWYDGFKDAGCEYTVHRYEDIGTLPVGCDLYFFVEIRYHRSVLPWFAFPRVLYCWDTHICGTGLIEQYEPWFDRIYLASRIDATKLTEKGLKKIRWLPEACNPRIHRNLHQDRTYNVGLVGGRDASLVRHGASRNDFVEYLLRQKEYSFIINDHYMHGQPYVDRMNQVKIGFDRAVSHNIGTRPFENAAMGVLPLWSVAGYPGIGMDELMTPWEHYVPYNDTIEGMDDVIKTCLKELYLVRYITEKAEKHVLENHTYANRVRTIIDDLFPRKVTAI